MTFMDEALATRIFGLYKAMGEETGRAYLNFTPEDQICFLDLGQSYAVFAGRGSPLSQARGRLSPEHLRAMQDFYGGRTERWEAIVGPFSDREALGWLCEAGATHVGWENLLYRPLAPDLREPDLPSGVTIDAVDEGLREVTAEVASRGFFGDEENDMIRDLKQLMQATPKKNYLARVEGEPAAAAFTIEHDGVAFLGGASTLEPFRGRGLQSALIWRRLRDAAERCDLAVLEAQVASSSQRNAERAGFRLGYTQLNFAVPSVES
jgi:hypothetical protein